MNRSLIVIAVLSVSLLVTVLAADRVAVSQGVKPAKIAGVNWPQIFERARSIAAINAWSEKQVAETEMLRQEFGRWVKTKREELELTEPGSKQYEDLKSEIERALWTRKSDDAFVSQRINVRQLEARYELDLRARKAIAKYANENGYNIVQAFHVLEIDAKKAKNPEQITSAIASRTILYWDETVDITDEILAILNAE